MKLLKLITLVVLFTFFSFVLAEQELTLNQALSIIKAAQEKAVEIETPINVAVVDEGGNLLAFARMDDAILVSIEIAIDKAWTALAVKLPTAELAEVAAPGGAVFGAHTTNNGRVMIFGGGIPIQVDNRVIGGIGVSGGSVEQDILVAEAGLAALNN